MSVATVKPLHGYYGGKGRLASWIVSMLPDHTLYCEPFAGSAAVLFAKPRSKVEVINDHNEDLINCYRVWSDPRGARELWRRLQYTLYSRAEYQRAGNFLANGDKLDRLEWAWAWMTRIGMAMGNIVTPVNSMSINRATAGSGNEAQWYKRDWRRSASRLRGVVIECDNALAVIRRWDCEDAVFYCDPPYPGSDQGHYKGYTAEDFAELVALLDTIQGSFLLSNYEQPGVPDHWERLSKEVTLLGSKGRKGASRDKRTEIVWRKLNAKHRASMAQQELFA